MRELKVVVCLQFENAYTLTLEEQGNGKLEHMTVAKTLADSFGIRTGSILRVEVL